MFFIFCCWNKETSSIFIPIFLNFVHFFLQFSRFLKHYVLPYSIFILQLNIRMSACCSVSFPPLFKLRFFTIICPVAQFALAQSSKVSRCCDKKNFDDFTKQNSTHFPSSLKLHTRCQTTFFALNCKKVWL